MIDQAEGLRRAVETSRRENEAEATRLFWKMQEAGAAFSAACIEYWQYMLDHKMQINHSPIVRNESPS